ncbi:MULTISPECIES: hypothetical protein [unclassified Photobacterium]|uniref:hypothetical protein n=1 Tax=unclassified Photobacterium TaxID=2628852 RepID=UPI001EDDC7F4|nr:MULTISPECIES: hypothetical protein [unclassified Photobacterium]MCG3862657.1 hypothetical protein [Photobacterium sp. Ph6]MCG3874188.1 hypothetical protein [Photobacterium sp. Ph5]
MEDKTLIADTHGILEAFIENGLHRTYPIYCQFPHCESLIEKHQYDESYDIEFNDGYRHQNEK